MHPEERNENEAENTQVQLKTNKNKKGHKKQKHNVIDSMKNAYSTKFKALGSANFSKSFLKRRKATLQSIENATDHQQLHQNF